MEQETVQALANDQKAVYLFCSKKEVKCWHEAYVKSNAFYQTDLAREPMPEEGQKNTEKGQTAFFFFFEI